jgi:hypothetical protein
MENPRRVNLADWLLVRFLNLGYPTLRPFLFPLQELKKFLKATSRSATDCCSGTHDTSSSQVLSSVCFALVMTVFCKSAEQGFFSDPLASELFISFLSLSVFSASSVVKSFRSNRKRYYPLLPITRGTSSI